jgi:hypothetical protein
MGEQRLSRVPISKGGKENGHHGQNDGVYGGKNE